MSRRTALAEACGTSPEYLWQIATRWRGKRPSPELAATIERESERLGPAKVHKEPLIFGTSANVEGTSANVERQQIAAEVDSRMSKRALRARLGLSSDAHLAKVLGLPIADVAVWPEEGSVPAVPQVLNLLGTNVLPAAVDQPSDPDADRIAGVDAA